MGEARPLLEELGTKDGTEPSLIALTHMYQGLALLAAGDLQDAETHLTRGLELIQAVGEPQHTAAALDFLGRLAWVQGDLAGARDRIEQSLTHKEAIGSHYGLGYTLTDLGDILQRTGDPSAARAQYARALCTLHAIGHAEPSHKALYRLAGMAMEAGEPVHALRLVSVSKALSAVTGVLPVPQVRTSIEQLEVAAREALSPEAQAAAWAVGEAMTMEQVIVEALGTAETEGR